MAAHMRLAGVLAASALWLGPALADEYPGPSPWTGTLVA
jgi:hypothetical protein